MGLTAGRASVAVRVARRVRMERRIVVDGWCGVVWVGLMGDMTGSNKLGSLIYILFYCFVSSSE
jgi:hypothetical protein